MTALLPGLAQWLADRGHGVYSVTDPYGPDDVGIVLGGLPATPGRAIALAAYPGPESNTNEPYDLVNVQVRLRGTTSESVSREAAQSVYDDLHGLGVVDLPNGSRLVNAVCLQGAPVWMGTDENNQHQHVINVRIEWRNPGRE